MKKLDDVLDMVPIDEQKNDKLPTTYRPSNDKDDLDNDVKYVRQNLYDLIEKGHGAIDELLAVADQSQHPRAYEVLATMIKTMAETNRDLIELQERKKKIQDKEPPAPVGVTNNNLFIGSTKELLGLLKQNNE
jgi:hypothetical protein